MTTTPMIELLDRDTAVHQISACIADRTHYVIGVGPSLIRTVTAGLAEFRSPAPERQPMAGLMYVDNNSGPILASTSFEAVALTALVVPLGHCVAVAAVPKSMPAAGLSRLLGDAFPADGSKDLIVVHDMPGQVAWPTLLVDALAVVDPLLAANLYANDRSNLS